MILESTGFPFLQVSIRLPISPLTTDVPDYRPAPISLYRPVSIAPVIAAVLAPAILTKVIAAVLEVVSKPRCVDIEALGPVYRHPSLNSGKMYEITLKCTCLKANNPEVVHENETKTQGA